MPGQEVHLVVTALSDLQTAINATDATNKTTLQAAATDLRTNLDRIGLTVRTSYEIPVAS